MTEQQARDLIADSKGFAVPDECADIERRQREQRSLRDNPRPDSLAPEQIRQDATDAERLRCWRLVRKHFASWPGLERLTDAILTGEEA